MKVPPSNLQAEESLLGAMLLSPAAVETAANVIIPEDFYDPKNQHIFEAACALWNRGEGIDPRTVWAELQHMGVAEAIDPGTLITYQAGTPATTNAAKYAELVVEAATRRRIIAACGDIIEKSYDPTSNLPDTLDVLRRYSTSLEVAFALPSPSPNIDDFLAVEEDDLNWVVPNVLSQQDRLILVGPEGYGKSTFMRQFAIHTSQGIHPFTLRNCQPKRVLMVDLENPPSLARKRMRGTVLQVKNELGDQFRPNNLRIEAKPEGINVLQRADRVWLEKILQANQPELLMIGPLYKLYEGEGTKQDEAQRVAKVFDSVRARFKCAVVIEHHAPKGDGHSRTMVPFGSSVWLRWPEFGMFIKPDKEDHSTAIMGHWRGPRDERQWPKRLHKGGKWLWQPVIDERF